jgi:integrase
MQEQKFKLTKRTVDAAATGPSRYIVMDNELSGFGLRVETSGVKTYFIRYRSSGGGRKAAQRFMTIGRHGALTPDEARREAKKLLGAVAAGSDPGGDRLAARKEMTVGELIEHYAEEGCFVQRGVRQGQPMKPITKRNTLARLRHHVVSLLGNRRVADLGPGEIERFFKDVAEGRSSDHWKGPAGKTKRPTVIKVRGGEGAARKVVRDLSAVLTFARRREIIVNNPVESAAVCKVDGRRTRFLTVQEFQQLGAALESLESDSGLNPKALNIVRLWALTGCRHNEIAGLKWAEVDFERGVLCLEATKTGRSIRPLGTPAVALLSSIPHEGNTPYVFPAESGEGHFCGMKRVWPRVIAKAGLGKEVTPHVLRHSVGAIAASSGEPLLIVGALLGHANPRSTAIYAHISLDPAIQAANRVSGSITEALNTRTQDNVVHFRPRLVSP